MNDINIHVKKVKAVQTKEMISGISRSLQGTSDVIGVLIAAVWVLGLVILLLAFTMSVNERKREFAVLRVIGASQGKLASIVMQEALLTGLCGSVLGTVLLCALPELLRAFRELHPEIKMDVLVRGDELPAALASGEIQLALVDEARAQGFDFLPLADTPLVAVVPPDFPWEGETIPLERLLREPFLSSPDQYIEPFLPPDTPRLEVTASDDGSILSMVAGGLGVSVLSAFSLVGYEGQVRVLQLEEPIALRLGAAVKSMNAAGTSARAFLSFLREYYGKDDTP